MNVNVKRNALAVGLLLFGSAIANEFPYSFSDPLLTKPEKLRLRDTFLGDATSRACAASNSDVQYLKEPLALATAVDLALCFSPQVGTAWAAIKIQAGVVGESKAAYLPTLNATVSQLRNRTRYADDITPDSSNQGITRYASLSLRLLDFGTRSANLASANHLLLAAIASHDAAVQKLLSSVISAYFDAITAQATYQARLQAVEIATGSWRTTQRLEAKGVAPVSDTLQASVALAKAKLALSRAQGDVKKTQSVLFYAMGLSTHTWLTLPQEDSEKPVASVNDLNQWLLDAQQLHPAIKAARSQLASSKAKIKLVQSEGLPYLDYTQNFYQNGYPNQGLSPTSSKVNTVGFTLTVPLMDGFARTYKVRGAQAQSEQSEAQLRDTELQVLGEVVKAHADAQASLASLEFAQQLLDASQAAMKTSQNRYDKGAADVLELLNAQSALAEAQQERVRCLADWRSARLRLIASVGGLTREGL